MSDPARSDPAPSDPAPSDPARSDPARSDPAFSARVREFHHAFGLGVRDLPDSRPDTWRLRIALLREEFDEYVTAAEAGNLVEVADALADMVYVIYGTACEYGIPLNDVLAEVHRSNMSKLGVDGRPVLRDDGKVLKGPAYSPPDVAAVLRTEALDRPPGSTSTG